MATLAEVIRERKSFLRQLRASLRRADSKLEVIERKLKQVIQRKNKVPEDSDLEQIAAMTQEMGREVNAFIGELDKGWAV